MSEIALNSTVSFNEFISLLFYYTKIIKLYVDVLETGLKDNIKGTYRWYEYN